MKISDQGIHLIQRFEGFRSKAYKCPAGVWTIGYGHTRTAKPGMEISEEEAIRLLCKDIQIYENAVKDLVKVDITQNQLDALVSFCYNLGEGNLKRSTLLKKLNRKDYTGAANEFLKWDKAGGKKLKGLTIRRQAERDLFLS